MTVGVSGQSNASNFNNTLYVAPPIGAILPWLKSLTGVPQTLMTGWVECNGQVLDDADSPLDGQTLPDLNTSNRFLRGNSTSGGTGGASTHVHSVSYTAFDTQTNVPWGSAAAGDPGSPYETSSVSILPSYYDTVFIIRTK